MTRLWLNYLAVFGRCKETPNKDPQLRWRPAITCGLPGRAAPRVEVAVAALSGLVCSFSRLL